MKKSTVGNKIIVITLIAIIALTIAGVFVRWTRENTALSDKMVNTGIGITEVVEIKNGKAVEANDTIPVGDFKAGTYTLNAEWWPEEELGFITGMLVTSDGKVVSAVTGNKLNLSNQEIELADGECDIKLYFLTTEEEYENFVDKYIGASDNGNDGQFEGFVEEGSYEVAYSFRLTNETLDNSKKISTYILVGIFIAVIIVLIAIVAKKTDGRLKGQYDERQIAVQGKAYKMAFFTGLGYTAIIWALDITEVKIPMDMNVVALLGILISTGVFATHSILEDAYVALNDSRKRTIIILGFIGVFNLVLGVINLFSREMFTYGKLNFRSSNLLCGITLVYILVIFLIKDIKDKEED